MMVDLLGLQQRLGPGDGQRCIPLGFMGAIGIRPRLGGVKFQHQWARLDSLTAMYRHAFDHTDEGGLDGLDFGARHPLAACDSAPIQASPAGQGAQNVRGRYQAARCRMHRSFHELTKGRQQRPFRRQTQRCVQLRRQPPSRRVQEESDARLRRRYSMGVSPVQRRNAR